MVIIDVKRHLSVKTDCFAIARVLWQTYIVLRLAWREYSQQCHALVRTLPAEYWVIEPVLRIIEKSDLDQVHPFLTG